MKTNSWLSKQYIAHRGLHNDNFPENSLPAFDNAIRHGFAIELDVHLLSDGTIAVFHDDSLKRMTGINNLIKNLRYEDLQNCKLAGTDFCIPTFNQVLELVNGKVPVLIEVKNDTKVGPIESKLIEILKSYNGPFAIQSFNPYSLAYFKKNAPEIPRGQLAGYFKGEKLSFVKKYVLKKMLLNKTVSSPNFISYEADKLPNKYVKKYNNLPILAWTIRNSQQHEKIKNYCDNIIFEGFEPTI